MFDPKLVRLLTLQRHTVPVHSKRGAKNLTNAKATVCAYKPSSSLVMNRRPRDASGQDRWDRRYDTRYLRPLSCFEYFLISSVRIFEASDHRKNRYLKHRVRNRVELDCNETKYTHRTTNSKPSLNLQTPWGLSLKAHQFVHPLYRFCDSHVTR